MDTKMDISLLLLTPDMLLQNAVNRYVKTLCICIFLFVKGGGCLPPFLVMHTGNKQLHERLCRTAKA